MAELRPLGSKEYKIPRGFLFEYVTCANYTTEIVGWVAFTLATQTAAAAIFAACGALQMGQWALQKHMRLRKVRRFISAKIVEPVHGYMHGTRHGYHLLYLPVPRRMPNSLSSHEGDTVELIEAVG